MSHKSDNQTMDVASAFEIFIASFIVPAFRRQTFVRRAVGPLWLLHHDYQWGEERRVGDDFFICGVAPAAALAAIQGYQPLVGHTLIVVADQPATLAHYTAAGYELAFTEYLMVRALCDLPPLVDQPLVQIIADQGMADWANARDPEGQPWLQAVNLADPCLIHYVTIAEERVVARLMRYDARCSYVTHVTTDPAYRRRGLARAVMLHLLHDCAARGEDQNVLVASEEGDLLYRSLGYSRLATIYVLTQREQKSEEPNK